MTLMSQLFETFISHRWQGVLVNNFMTLLISYIKFDLND